MPKSTQSATVGQRIRDLRHRARLSQSALGARCKPPIRREHVAHYECGHLEPGLDVITRLADALNVSLDALVPRPRRAA